MSTKELIPPGESRWLPTAHNQPMISAEAAALAISVAKGVLKLAGRIDRLMAEKEAVQGALVIPMPPESHAPDVEICLQMLRDYVDSTKSANPDPLGTDRERLRNLLAQNPVPDGWSDFFERLFPEKAHPPPISPDATYLKALKQWVPSVNWDEKTNRELCIAAFHIASGRDDRGLSYGARVGLIVADVVAEFGAQHTALFIRDKNAQAIVGSVLQRFSEPELEKFEDWSPFLREALSATLNGLLDSSRVFEGQSRWADALLEALARARKEAPDGDDYLLGLLRGRGYGLLIGEGLQAASRHVAEGHAGLFRDVVADLLVKAAPLVKANKGDFGTFFKEHWADLVRGGLLSLANQGPRLLEGKSPLLQQTLLAVTRRLAVVPSTEFFSAETLVQLGQAAVAVVARNPTLLKPGVNGDWLQEWITAVAATIHDGGLRAVFSRDTLEEIFTETLSTFARHPEIIIAKPGVGQDIVAATLNAIAASGLHDSGQLARSAVHGALQALSISPELGQMRFGAHLASAAGVVAECVKDGQLGVPLAADLLATATDAMLRNPRLFAASQDNVAAAVLRAVIAAARKSVDAGDGASLLDGALLVNVAREVFATVARFGAEFVRTHDTVQQIEELTRVIAAGVERAREELGRGIDSTVVPVIIAGLVRKLVRGELADFDPGSDAFKKVFTQLANAAVS